MFRLILAFAFMGSLAELSLLGWRRYALGKFLGVNKMIVWMNPLTAVLAFSGLWFLAKAYGRLRKQPQAERAAAIFLASWMALLWPLARVDEIHLAASVIFSAGAAAQIARVVTKHWDRALRASTMIVLGSVTVILALTLAVHGPSWLPERRSASALGLADTPTPNVLLIILDTVRAKSLSSYGASRPTSPAIDAFAEAGVRFDRAIATAPWTLPSHVSLVTGRYPREVNADYDIPYRDKHRTLAESFSESGYRTGGFVANFAYVGWESGIARGFSHFDDYQLTVTSVLASTAIIWRTMTHPRFRSRVDITPLLGGRDAPSVTDAFLNWSAQREDQPYFALLNYFDAHAPYRAPEPFATQFGVTEDPDFLTDQVGLDAPDLPNLALSLNAYEGSIAGLDADIGRLLDSLEARGDLDNTIVIITSDHGEEMGEHGRIGHGSNLFEPVLRVPLIVRFPRAVPGGVVVRHPVSIADIPATLLDLAQRTDPEIPGESLAPNWRGTRAGRAAISVQDDMESVVIGSKHFGANVGDQPIWFFDLVADLEETNDLSDELTDEQVECLKQVVSTPNGPWRNCGIAENEPDPAVR